MPINNLSLNRPNYIQDNNNNNNQKRAEEKETAKKPQVDEYIPSKDEPKVTYGKPKKVDQKTIDALKAESELHYRDLIETVKQLLQKQGYSVENLSNKDVMVEVDEETRLAAQAAIADNGPLSAENVSDNILKFAKAISGDDPAKIGLLRKAIDDGFKAAANVLGGKLPEISQKTYDLVQEKLDAWENEGKETAQ